MTESRSGSHSHALLSPDQNNTLGVSLPNYTEDPINTTLTRCSCLQATSRVGHAAFPDNPVSLPLLLPVLGAAGVSGTSEGPDNCQI